jgi:hypothetical protein
VRLDVEARRAKEHDGLKKKLAGGATATQRIAPPVPNYTHCLHNKITQQTDPTHATYATYILHSDQRLGGG